MSLIGAHSAVVSLGASCQPARQIRLNQDLLSARLGDALHPKTLPLDWMFAPPDAAARVIASTVRVPPARGELIRAEQPFWARHGLWLWHDPIAHDADFAAMQARQARRWARFDALASLKRRVFVVANTQNNLLRVAHAAPQRLDFTLTAQRMQAIAAAIAGHFGGAGNTLLFLAYASRLTPDAHKAGFPLAVLEPDATDHEGDDAQWRAAFEKLIP
jgi:hypothetical protein